MGVATAAWAVPGSASTAHAGWRAWYIRAPGAVVSVRRTGEHLRVVLVSGTAGDGGDVSGVSRHPGTTLIDAGADGTLRLRSDGEPSPWLADGPDPLRLPVVPGAGKDSLISVGPRAVVVACTATFLDVVPPGGVARMLTALTGGVGPEEAVGSALPQSLPEGLAVAVLRRGRPVGAPGSATVGPLVARPLQAEQSVEAQDLDHSPGMCGGRDDRELSS